MPGLLKMGVFILYAAGLKEKLADQLAIERTLAAALQSHEQELVTEPSEDFKPCGSLLAMVPASPSDYG